MYRSVDEVLRDVYRLHAVRIEPMNNTAQVMQWCEYKGVRGGGGELTQHEHHANAAMVIARVERVLNRYELAVVQCQYSADYSGIIDLTAFIERQNKGVNLLICDAVLSNLFSGQPKQTAIMDKYDLSKGHFYRQQKKVKGIVAALLDSAVCKLQDEFESCRIIEKDAA
ncbi:hypothetical protein PL75_03300 [Neisseria arctica]|uniref:Phage antitermination protein Q n=1 Tax=Neisseria arctica TaxID=1470200 RepID=A0A0J0YSY2_9NEIS|nr:hypothetical protein [Neisseria arctica]KLT73265.1 hypothetical protein PL75_03300 [Neisseria arctica]UOO87480.1 hypothetical protein LVJ86_04345 [Neisseria arctica]